MGWSVAGHEALDVDPDLRGKFLDNGFLQIENCLALENYTAVCKEIDELDTKFGVTVRDRGAPKEQLSEGDPRIHDIHARWSEDPSEPLSYCYRVLQLKDIPKSGPIVKAISTLFSSKNIDRLSRITNQKFEKCVFIGVTKYLPHDYLGPHRDDSTVQGYKRHLAFNLCLHAPKSGGELVYLDDRGRKMPMPMRDNMLSMFDLRRTGTHFVQPAASGRPYRTSLVGFLCTETNAL